MSFEPFQPLGPVNTEVPPSGGAYAPQTQGMASLKAQDQGDTYAEGMAGEGRNTFTNSIWTFSETACQGSCTNGGFWYAPEVYRTLQ